MRRALSINTRSVCERITSSKSVSSDHVSSASLVKRSYSGCPCPARLRHSNGSCDRSIRQLGWIQALGGRLEHIKAFASKSPEQAARIAGVLTLLQSLEAPEVTAEVMADGIALAAYYLSEARRLSETAAVSAETDAADHLLKWLKESWPGIARSNNRTANMIVPRDVVNFGPNAMRETAYVKKLVHTLANHGWLTPLDKGTEVDGQVRQLAYRVVTA
ncbi:MAG: DUF3987 domain-containing protein [Paracoccaceae bacterium]